ncbi:MAG: hypothetical protein D6707_10360 [Bacteroidetes bacterium]|nr:MAG: hypothetical protein D6707_10360 [Bacteroidota bacterium]
MKKWLLYALPILWLSACAPSRFVEPLQEKQSAVGFSFGGELIDYGGMTIPLPLTSFSYGYGIDSTLTAFGGLHTTALYFNNLQLDLGVTKKIYQGKKYVPSISLSPALNIIKDLNDPILKIWPQIDVNAYWYLGKKQSYIYAGVSNWFELAKYRANEQPQIQRWIYNPQTGIVWKAWEKMWFNAEIKFLAPNQSNQYSFIPWKSALGTRGATGIFIGLTKTF